MAAGSPRDFVSDSPSRPPLRSERENCENRTRTEETFRDKISGCQKSSGCSKVRTVTTLYGKDDVVPSKTGASVRRHLGTFFS